ncbi:RNA 2',3'-cyclic phosphodiesterase [Nocardioides gansuensis]|uniref:RNA 2',3'-cyclic phosphodiesterase n=1 Tax=Nocardioides gansuensis TaxID=2138300 RepID=A0A2T8F9E0_9ACTN|nr:RNA 2',3'-cyclic phosphodiesterase [Nocardioides gansuensis]PVG82332.1 RNA 2',3'-cyclic phosphodiesterase [Nocardioides gansuensis]
MRLFVAAIPPEDVTEDLESFLSPRREAGDFRWSLPEQWHVTLAFMESVPDRVLDDLVERLGRAAARRHPMELRIAGGGAFPHADRARVLYAALAASEDDRVELGRLATGARAAASKAGAAVDGRRWHGHLTLARLGRPANVSKWVRLLDAYSGPAWRLDEIALVASYLGEGPRKRPRYDVLEVFPLGTRRH